MFSFVVTTQKSSAFVPLVEQLNAQLEKLEKAKGVKSKGFKSKAFEAKGFKSKGVEAKSKGFKSKGFKSKGFKSKVWTIIGDYESKPLWRTIWYGGVNLLE